jgi:hypothetical protein
VYFKAMVATVKSRRAASGSGAESFGVMMEENDLGEIWTVFLPWVKVIPPTVLDSWAGGWYLKFS